MSRLTRVRNWKVVVVAANGQVFEQIKKSGELINECFKQDSAVLGELLMQIVTGHCFTVVRSDKSRIHFCCCGQGEKHENEASS